MHLHALDSNLKSCCEVKKNTDRSDSETSSRKRITNWQCLELKATESYNQRNASWPSLLTSECSCPLPMQPMPSHHGESESVKVASYSVLNWNYKIYNNSFWFTGFKPGLSFSFQGIELCFVGYTRNIKKHVCLNDKLINASSLRRAWKCATSTEPDSLLRKHWRDFVRMEADCESAGQNKQHQPHHIFLPIKLAKCNIHPVLPGSFVRNKGETERKKSGWIVWMDKSMRSISILSAK